MRTGQDTGVELLDSGVEVLGGPANIDTLSTYLYRTWTTDPSRQGTVSAAASALLLLVTLMLLLRNRVEGHAGRYLTAAGNRLLRAGSGWDGCGGPWRRSSGCTC